MALRSDDDRAAAQKAFQIELRDKVTWIQGECFASNLLRALEELAKILTAGYELGLSGDSSVYISRIDHPLYETLHPLIVIRAKKQIRARLLEFLKERGVDMSIF